MDFSSLANVPPGCQGDGEMLSWLGDLSNHKSAATCPIAHPLTRPKNMSTLNTKRHRRIAAIMTCIAGHAAERWAVRRLECRPESTDRTSFLAWK